jgi:hypothetical protein
MASGESIKQESTHALQAHSARYRAQTAHLFQVVLKTVDLFGDSGRICRLPGGDPTSSAQELQ